MLQTYNRAQWVVLIVSIPLLVMCGLWGAYRPLWTMTALFVAFLALIAVFSHQKVLYLLVFPALLDPNYMGLAFHYHWNVFSGEGKNVFPLYPFILAFAMAGLILSRLRPGSMFSTRDSIIPILILFCFWAFFSTTWAPNTEHGLFQATIPACGILLYFFVVESLDSSEFLYRICWVWILLGLLVGLANIAVRYSPDVNFIQHLHDRIYFAFQIRGTNVLMRSDTISNANLTALTLNLFMCVAVGMFLHEKSSSRKAFLLAALAVMLFGQFLNMSKGGTLGFVLMVVYLITVLDKFRKNFLMYGFLAAIFFIATFSLNQLYLAQARGPRLLHEVGTGGSSLVERMRMWDFGWEHLAQEGLAIGLGAGGYTHLHDAPHAHSIPFSILFDFGFMGFFLFCLVVLVLSSRFFRLVTHQKTFAQLMFLSLCGGLVAISFQGLFDGTYTLSVLYFFLGLCTSSFLLAEKELGQIPPPSGERV